MDKDKEIAHINGRYLVLVAIFALLGTLVTIYFNVRNSVEVSKTKTEILKSENVTENEISNLQANEQNQIKTTAIQNDGLNKNLGKKKEAPIVGMEVIITLKDEVSKEPISDAVFSLDNFSEPIKSDNLGRITIPRILIEKFGNYNSVLATIKKEGYQTEKINIALSESHSIFLNKLK